jgi:hypothetical protein
MRKPSACLTSILFILLVAATCSGPTPSKEKQAQYFAGVFLLQSAADPNSQRTTELFHELETLTGINAAKAMKLLNEYRENPEQWQNISVSIQTILTNAEKKQTTEILNPQRFLPVPAKRR